MPPEIAATVAWTGTVAVRSRIAASCHRRCDREALPPARARGSGWCTLGQACLAGLPVGCVLGPSEPRGVGCEVGLPEPCGAGWAVGLPELCGVGCAAGLPEPRGGGAAGRRPARDAPGGGAAAQ